MRVKWENHKRIYHIIHFILSNFIDQKKHGKALGRVGKPETHIVLLA